MPLGDGHAVLQAAHVVGNEPVLVLFGDCIYDSKIPASRQLIDTFEQYGSSVVGLSHVELHEVSKFGVIEGSMLDESTYQITKLIEKPKPEVSQSNLVAVGKYIITPEVMDVLASMPCGNSGEIRLIDAFQILLEKNRPLCGKVLQGEWLDTGDKFNFIKATIKLGLKHPEVREKLREFLKEMNLNQHTLQNLR
jgi:UTP--glucose-1-phosphate uridylyltransferase